MAIILSNSSRKPFLHLFQQIFFFCSLRGFPWRINCSAKCSRFWALWLIFFVFSVHHYRSVKHTHLIFAFLKPPDLITSADARVFVEASTFSSLRLRERERLVTCPHVLQPREFFSPLECVCSSLCVACTCVLSVTPPPSSCVPPWCAGRAPRCHSRCLRYEDEESMAPPAACEGISN